MCNPGSADSESNPGGESKWEPINARNDQTLNIVRDVLIDVDKANQLKIQDHDYLQVLNLFYSCGSDIEEAFTKWLENSCTHWESVSPQAKFIWVAWGKNVPLGLIPLAKEEIGSSQKPLFFLDLFANASGLVSRSFRKMWYPAHPLNLNFRRNRRALATEIASYL